MRVGVPSSLVEAARQSSERGCESEVEASCVVCVWVWMFVFPGVIERIYPVRMLIPVQNFLPSRLASPLPFQYQSRFESSFVERDGISSNSFFQGIPSGHYGLESARSIGEWHERIRFSQSAKPSQADARIPPAKQRTGEEFAPPGPTTTNTPSPPKLNAIDVTDWSSWKLTGKQQ